MSYSELWEINRNWSGKVYKEYKNSWLFCPIVWDLMFLKYIPQEERKDVYGENFNNYMSWILWSSTRNERINKLNAKILDSDCESDKIVWDLSNLVVFNWNDRKFISDCITKFIENHNDFFENHDEEIRKRFEEIANDISNLPHRCKYFVIHGSSCDDNVESWFEHKRLSSWNEFICDFALISNNKLIGYSDNLKITKERNQYENY